MAYEERSYSSAGQEPLNGDRGDIRNDDGICAASKDLIHEVLQLRSRIALLRASPKRFECAPRFGLGQSVQPDNASSETKK
jgi:hypothetical protein